MLKLYYFKGLSRLGTLYRKSEEGDDNFQRPYRAKQLGVDERTSKRERRIEKRG